MITRLHSLLLSACTLALEALVAPVATFAQTRPGLECWATTVAQTASSLNAAERVGVPPLLHVLDQAEALLRADQRINALDGNRARVHRFIGHPATKGAPLMADASVWLHRRPDVFGPSCTLLRGADYTHHAELSVQLNQLDALYGLLASPQEVQESGTFPLPPAPDTVQGVPVYGHADAGSRVLVLTRDGVPPFVRVPNDEIRWRVNPALFAGATPGSVRVIVLSLVINDDADAQRDPMQEWLRRADLRAWRALLAP